MKKYEFTFKKLKQDYIKILENGYSVMGCHDYVKHKISKSKKVPKILVNRVDIDESCYKAKKIAKIFNDLDIKGTFFIRLHAKEYNPFSLNNYPHLNFIIQSGHEIGYHSEVIDESVLWKEEADMCMKRDIGILNAMFDIRTKGIASHGGFTGYNNLDFWKIHKPEEYGLLYEAYDKESGFNLFNESLYVSDSEWVKWKTYNKGKLVKNEVGSPADHASKGVKLIYSLIHPETYR